MFYNTDDNAFSSDSWLELAIQHLRDSCEMCASDFDATAVSSDGCGGCSTGVVLPHNLFSVLTDAFKSILSNHSGSCHIVDFGGGAGRVFPFIIKELNGEQLSRIQYTIVENCLHVNVLRDLLLCEKIKFGKIKEFESPFKDIDFNMVDNAQAIKNNVVDYIIVSSVLHYVSDYRFVLNELLNLSPRGVFLLRLMCHSDASSGSDLMFLQSSSDRTLSSFFTPFVAPHISSIHKIAHNCSYDVIADEQLGMFQDGDYDERVPKHVRKLGERFLILKARS